MNAGDEIEAPESEDIEVGIRADLAIIVRNWRHLTDPPKVVGVSGGAPKPGSRLPGSTAAIVLRADITHTLAYWVHAFLDDHPDVTPTRKREVPLPTLTYTTTWTKIDEPAPLDLTDVLSMCSYLSAAAPLLAVWQFGEAMWSDVRKDARAARRLAMPPVRETMPLGECSVCGEVVRAKIHDPGNIKCKGCGTTDTVDGWIIRLVGTDGPVTAEQLVPILRRRLGISTSRATIRKWVQRHVIFTCGTDERGRALFNRRDVFEDLIRRKEIAG